MLQLHKKVLLLEKENIKINNEKQELATEIDKYTNVLKY